MSTIWRRRVRRLVVLWPILLGGCLLPVPTDVPRNLPAHGHTYYVRDRQNRPVQADGILIVHTFYEGAEERIDCYPIQEGKAVVPTTLDVRIQDWEMIPYFACPIAPQYVFFHNGDHAHVYPLVPGLVNWDDFFSPGINRGRHIHPNKPPPEVLRMFPLLPREELEILKQVEMDMEIAIKKPYRFSDSRSRETLHNERTGRLVLQYVGPRKTALKRAHEQGPSPPQDGGVTGPPVPASTRIRCDGLTPAEQAFRALEACDYVTLKRLLDEGLDPNSYDVEPWTLLHRAVGLGDLKAVKMLVERGADVNRKLPDHAEGWFSFHYSETDDHAKLRLEAEGHSPVVLATCGGHLEILKYLVSRGGKIITLTPDYTLLHAAAGGICTIHGDDGPGRRAVIRYLLDTGADINAVYYAGCGQNRRTTPLDMARRCGKTRTARFLEQHGARSSAGPTSRAASQPAGPAGGSDR